MNLKKASYYVLIFAVFCLLGTFVVWPAILNLMSPATQTDTEVAAETPTTTQARADTAVDTATDTAAGYPSTPSTYREVVTTGLVVRIPYDTVLAAAHSADDDFTTRCQVLQHGKLTALAVNDNTVVARYQAPVGVPVSVSE